MRASLVVNQASGRDRYWATRGGGAFLNGSPIRPSACTDVKDAIVGISGLPKFKPEWAQFRALGAAALDICLVADGSLDGWVDMNSHGVWDYLASSLICQEAGVQITEILGRDYVTTEYDDKCTLVVASTKEMLGSLLDIRKRHADS
jgi:myo-inositol-1(or 4)-monophosphatase